MATDRDLWEVPFFVWMSPEFKARYPDKVSGMELVKDLPLQSDQLFYGLLDFLGVEGLGCQATENFLDDKFSLRDPRCILGGKDKYRWSAP